VASNRLKTKIKVVTETETVSQVAVYKEIQILHDYTFHTFLETTYTLTKIMRKFGEKDRKLSPIFLKMRIFLSVHVLHFNIKIIMTAPLLTIEQT